MFELRRSVVAPFTLALLSSCGGGQQKTPLDGTSSNEMSSADSEGSDESKGSAAETTSANTNEEDASASATGDMSSVGEETSEDSIDDDDSGSDDDDNGDSGDENESDDDDDGESNDDAGDANDDDNSSDDGPKFDFGTIPDIEVMPPGDCNVDFLFVIDNSGSMLNEQENIAASVPDFISTMTTEIENLKSYHIGVVSTDENLDNGEGCRELGGLVTETRNVLPKTCGPYSSGANFMDDSDDLHQAFTCAAMIGFQGSDNEMPMAAVQAALSPELMAPGKCNEDFLRDDAVLVIVTLTDEEDDQMGTGDFATGSPGSPSEWHRDVMAVKSDREGYVVQLSLIGTEKPNECERLSETGKPLAGDAEISPRLVEYTELFGKYGVVGDVCAPNYAPFFKSAVSVIKLACDSIPPG